MSVSKFTVTRGVVFERVGDELMVVIPGRQEVVRLSGETADVFLDVQAGKSSHPSTQVLSDLEALGVIETSGMSRRGLIKAGAIGAGAGIAVMAMPGVAAASSHDEAEELFGIGFFAQIGAPDEVVAVFGEDKKDDLYFGVIVDYSGDVPKPANLTEGTVTAFGFSGSRTAVFIAALETGIWIARVSDQVPGGTEPTAGDFELLYPGFRVTQAVV